MGSHAAPRLRSFAYTGFRAYSVTCCTSGRRRWFDDADVVERVRSQLFQLAAERGFDISAYCFMSDHVHFLLDATAADADFCRLINVWKQKTGFAHSRTTGERLWQHGYYEHVLRRDEDRLKAIAYIVNNPVRAGLVRDPAEYRFWGSSVWRREELLQAIQMDRGG